MKLHVRLLIALVLGIVLGTALSPYAQGTWIAAVNTSVLRPIGQSGEGGVAHAWTSVRSPGLAARNFSNDVRSIAAR